MQVVMCDLCPLTQEPATGGDGRTEEDMEGAAEEEEA
jgi:hypothetical protein